MVSFVALLKSANLVLYDLIRRERAPWPACVDTGVDVQGLPNRAVATSSTLRHARTPKVRCPQCVTVRVCIFCIAGSWTSFVFVSEQVSGRKSVPLRCDHLKLGLLGI